MAYNVSAYLMSCRNEVETEYGLSNDRSEQDIPYYMMFSKNMISVYISSDFGA